MKETKIEIPADCEVDKIETQDGHIVVTFREKKRRLPKSFEEFCRDYDIKVGECRIMSDGLIANNTCRIDRNIIFDSNVLPDLATAEAVIALCQLVQLRNCYNGDFVPDWKDGKQTKFVIAFSNNVISSQYFAYANSEILYFKTKELRDEFLRNFRPLVEKLKPLYGIKEGGEE